MNAPEQHPSRRNFVQGLATGAVLSPYALTLGSTAHSQVSNVQSQSPNLVTGDLARTQGELLGDGKLREMERQIPVAGRSQVLVCGAGPAGIGAAVAAARAGADTQLIEVAGCLGGIWTAGLLTKIIDSGNKSGVMKEILSTCFPTGAIQRM